MEEEKDDNEAEIIDSTGNVMGTYTAKTSNLMGGIEDDPQVAQGGGLDILGGIDDGPTMPQNPTKNTYDDNESDLLGGITSNTNASQPPQ